LTSLMGQSNQINLDKIFKKYRQLKRYLGEQLETTWFSIYTTTTGDDSGTRSLRNMALSYMILANEEKHFELAVNQQTHSDNMTDELAALVVIAKSKIKHKHDYIQNFYSKWKDDALVMDKWFSAQVMLDDESVLNNIHSLLEHEKFSIKNPNKVRSVIGSFVAGNLTQFHSPTGNGYKFLADAIIRLNEINPQVAARLTTQFNQWKKLDDKRQALIKEQLERIKVTNNLSNDVYEIVDKSLNMD